VDKFNNLVVCTGGLPLKDAPSNFTNSLYVEDHFAKVWRHKACSYFLSAVNDAGKNTTCVFCVKIKKAVRDFKYCRKKMEKKYQGYEWHSNVQRICGKGLNRLK
jgi:hypothetical protein